MIPRGSFRRGSLRVFVLGCLIGAALALTLNYLEEKIVTASHKPVHNTTRNNNSNFIQRSQSKKELIDYEDLIYGSSSVNETEAFILAQVVHVLCIVFVRDDRKAIAARDTWGSHCNELMFFGPPKNYSAPVIELQAKSSWHFLCESIRIIWESHKANLRWVLFLSESQFAIPENLRYYVANLNYEKPYYMGHAIKFWGVGYNVAQAGYVLSKGAVKAIDGKFQTSDSCITGGKFWKNEDYYLGKHLREMGVYPEDTRDSLGKGRFHGYNFNQLLFPGKISSLASYWTKSIYPVKEGKNCCSDYSITFHGTEPDKMYQHNYLIYQLKVFVHGGHIGNQPAPTPFPEDSVWKNFLIEEGIRGKNVEDISSEEFFNIWKEKISGPANFNKKLIESGLHHSNSDILYSILLSAMANSTSAGDN